MPKKITFEYVKNYIESEDGYKLLSKEYVDSQTKLEIQCPEGHIYWASYNHFQQGNRCSMCYGKKKHTYEEVKEFVESFKGYTLLSEEYENNNTKLKIQCPEGHVFWKTYSNFRKSQKCPECHHNSKKLTYQQVKTYIESEGYKLLSEEYKNCKAKLEMQCPEGHIFWKTYGDFQQGSRCKECYDKRRSQNRIFSYEEVKKYIESFDGYKLLSKEYKTADSKLEIQCPEGHVYWTKFGYFKQGRRCPECYGNKKHTYQQVKTYIESFEGYKLLSKEYKNSKTNLKMQCPEGHIFWTKYNTFQQDHRCPKCYFESKTISNQEIIEKLGVCESIRETEDKQIEVKCTYCGQWHIPERSDLVTRIRYIEGRYDWENRLYCSQQCKSECPIYKQILYPKDFKPATSREVQPQLRQMVLARDNYTCQKCNKHKDQLDVGLHCHHIYPLNESPITSADIDECITFCKDCHKWVHMNVPGCGYAENKCSA